jgi:FKBP-type peptidyl-prolyl cis-trans isomerase FklB
MSKKLYFAFMFMACVLLTSCKESTEASIYDNWQARNEAFIDSIADVYATEANHGGLERIELLTDPGEYLYYKKLTPVTNLEGYVYDPAQIPVDQSSSVDVYYRGTNILGECFDGFTGADPTVYDAPSTFTVLYGSVITGWWEVLQHMPLGERWEVYIPWSLAYGSSGSGSILGYSTLIFDMQLYQINDLSFSSED